MPSQNKSAIPVGAGQTQGMNGVISATTIRARLAQAAGLSADKFPGLFGYVVEHGPHPLVLPRSLPVGRSA